MRSSRTERGDCDEDWERSRLERSLVQILVVVAIIQMRTLKTEAREGSAATAIVRRLGGPKYQVKPTEFGAEILSSFLCERESG